MKSLREFLIVYFLPALVALSVIYGAEKVTSSPMQVCKHEYALCTSAKCIPQPGDPSQAICMCDVKNGPSMATAPCETLSPSTDKNGIRTLYSTFSFAQYHEGKKGMKCPSGTPWTWCLNKKCTVDPSDPKKALCICDVIRTDEWTTLGGKCDTSTCGSGYWSGATMQALEEGNVFLVNALSLKQSPVKWCPAK